MKVTKKQKPALQIELPEDTTKCSFQLKKSVAEELRQYAEFLSDHHRAKVPEESVLETLLSKLAKDNLFKLWKKEKAGAQP